MNSLQHIFSTEFIEAIGWTIVHSLWQGTVVAILLSILILLMKRNSAQLKYLVSFFALLVMLGWSGVTFVNAYNYATEKAILRENIRKDPNYIRNFLEEKIATDALDNEEDKASINLQLIRFRSFFQRNFNLICFVWIVGMIFLIVRMIGGFIYARRLRTYQLIGIGEEWMMKIEAFANQLNIKRKVQAFFSPLAKVPMTLGTLKPVILFPVTAFTGLSVKDIEAIIAHELAHIVRHDYLFNIIQSIVEIVFFYHPAVWMISAQIRNERENSCDNIAIELTGDKVAYVKALAAVQINQVEHGQLAMAFASPKGNILQRITRLQKQVAMKTNFIEGLIAAAVVVIGLTLVSFTMGNSVTTQVMPDENIVTALPTDDSNSSNETPAVWTAEKIDSVRDELEYNIQHSEELDEVSEEMKKMVEVAMSEKDHELSVEMMEELNKALKELDIEGIVREAMYEAQKALNEIDMEEIKRDMENDFNSEEFHRDMEEAKRDIEEARRDIREARREVREEMRRDMKADGDVPEEVIELSVKAAEAGLNVAEAVLENLPLEEIIGATFDGIEAAFDALGEIDFDELKEEIARDLDDSISEEDIERLKSELEWREKELKAQKEKLKEKEKELKSMDKK